MRDEPEETTYAPITLGSPRFHTREVGGLRVTDAWFPPGARLERHAHERRVFSVMLEGSFDLIFDRRELDCSPSTVFTEPGGESHANAVGSGGAHVVVVQPAHDLELVGPCVGMLDRIHHFKDGTLSTLARRLGREVRDPDEVSKLAVEALALEMLVVGARRTRGERIANEPPGWLRRVEEMVHERFREKLRIDDLAAEAGVHPAHLARVFREHYGTPVGTFIRRLRLEWAADQLVSTDHSLSRIAYDAGFADQSHFTRAFRRTRGMPPGRYRTVRTGGGGRTTVPPSPEPAS